jgi:hypothetical protein
MQFGSGAAAQARNIHCQTTPRHGEQVEHPENDVSQEPLQRAFPGRHICQPPGELQHLLGCRSSQGFIHVEVAVVPAPRNDIGEEAAEHAGIHQPSVHTLTPGGLYTCAAPPISRKRPRR